MLYYPITLPTPKLELLISPYLQDFLSDYDLSHHVFPVMFSTFHPLWLVVTFTLEEASCSSHTIWCGTINLVIVSPKITNLKLSLPDFCCRCFCLLLPDFCLWCFSFAVKLLHKIAVVLLVTPYVGFCSFLEYSTTHSLIEWSRFFPNLTLLSKFVTFSSNILSTSLILSGKKFFFELTDVISNSCASVDYWKCPFAVCYMLCFQYGPLAHNFFLWKYQFSFVTFFVYFRMSRVNFL